MYYALWEIKIKVVLTTFFLYNIFGDKMKKNEIERSIIKTYRKEIWSNFMKAISEYDLIQENDCICVCISGGKDSMLLAKCFQILERFSKVPFTLKYLVMNPGYNAENLERIKENAKLMGIPITIKDSIIFDVVKEIDKSPCYVCARMRRGYLYRFAKEMGCNKIALGHHYDDVIETILMNIFYSGELKTMMPKLHSLNFEGMELIRPLYLVKERDILRWKNHNHLQFLQCACRFTEMQEKEKNAKVKTSKRDEMKALIEHYRQINPVVESNIFKSVSNVNLDKVIEYFDEKKRVNFLENYKNNTK